MVEANEHKSQGEGLAWRTAIEQLKFNSDGLIPAIAQQHDTLEVLMMAWMNRVSLEETINTGRVCYWSRSRQKLWRKGETSGQIQQLKTLRVDCDGDTILLMVGQTGPACHTGRRNCFYNEYDHDQKSLVVVADPIIDPNSLYK